MATKKIKIKSEIKKMNKVNVKYESVKFVTELGKEGNKFSAVRIKFDDEFALIDFFEGSELALLKRILKLDTENINEKVLPIRSVELVTDTNRFKQKSIFLYLNFDGFNYTKKVKVDDSTIAMINMFYNLDNLPVSNKKNETEKK